MPDPKPDSKTIRTLQGVARALSRLSRERARAAGADLTPQQAESLQLLAERGVTSTSTLAHPSTASRNLAGLERRGYIVRRRGTEDGRQTDVRLTARGKRTAEAVSSGWSEVMASLLDRFPRAERPRIADALDTLARVLDGGGDR
jgi:DNA-binding MarR family transcriptional regulator